MALEGFARVSRPAVWRATFALVPVSSHHVVDVVVGTVVVAVGPLKWLI